jgi:hypothetical protein
MAYIITASGTEERFSKRQAAVDRAVELAPTRHQVEVWSRPFWAVAVVRHYADGDILLHKFDRYGRELPGDLVGTHTHEEDPMIGENAAAAADFAQPVCECGMLAEECACTDDPAPGVCTDCGAETEGPDVLLCDDCKPESEQDDTPDLSGVYRDHLALATGGYHTVVVERCPNEHTRYFANYADESQITLREDVILDRLSEGRWTLTYSTVDDDAPEIPADVRAMVPARFCSCGAPASPNQPYCLECARAGHAFFLENARLMGKTVLAGAALLATLMLPGHASADTLAQVPAGCAITHTFEDASAIASCANGTRMAFDADGGFMQDHGIVFFYRAPGTWYEIK